MEGETLGSRIRAKRVERDITQADLASLVGLSVQSVNRIEVGLIPQKMIADYIPMIASQLGTTEEVLMNGGLDSERATGEELRRMRKEGLIRGDEELDSVLELATQFIRKRSKVNIPLSRQELLNLIEVIRGADGL